MKLSSLRIYDWPSFIYEYNIDIGDIVPVGHVVYDTGYEIAGDFQRVPYKDTIAFAHARRIWLVYNGTAEDETPFLAMAWLNLFPRCEWLPEQFGDAGSWPDYYHNLPPEDADRIVGKLKQSLQLDLKRSQAGLAQLEQYERRQGAV